MDVIGLYQAGPLIILSETDISQGDDSYSDSEVDPSLGLEGSYLADYLRDKAEWNLRQPCHILSSHRRQCRTKGSILNELFLFDIE